MLTGGPKKWIAIAAAAMAVYIGLAVLSDSAAIVAALKGLGFAGVGAVLGLSLFNYLVRFLRWHVLLARLGRSVPFGRHALYYLAGFAFTVSPGKAGEAVRSIYLREHEVPYSESLALAFVERLLDVLAIAILASLILLSDPRYGLAVLIGIGSILMLVVLIRSGLMHRLPWPRRPATWLRAAQNQLQGLLQSIAALLNPSWLVLGVLAGLLAWAAEGWGLYLLAEGLEVSVSPLAAIGIYSIAVLAGAAAFFMPGGIGGTEAVMAALLVQHGVPLGAAVAITLLCRLATLWFAVALGFAALALMALQASRTLSKTA